MVEFYTIGIAGKAGAGKSTVGRFLRSMISESFVLPFADEVKNVAKYMGWDGKKNEKGRRLLQLLGTECGRMCINTDLWVTRWLDTAYRHSYTGRRIIIADDVRFENEAEIIRRFGKVIHILGRNDPTVDPTHASEIGIQTLEDDSQIWNNSSFDNLFTRTKDLADGLRTSL